MKEKSRQRLAMLKRGEILQIPNRAWVHCPKCEVAVPWNLKKCQMCRATLPPRPPKRCRLCGGEVRGRRRSWCGDECQNAYYIATNSHYLREKIEERDCGVCAECGLDTAKLRRRVNGFKLGEPERQAALQVIKDQGFNVYPYPWRRCPSLWHADHVAALDEGGAYELSNVQTLCHPCHKIKTAEHATRKGKQRRLMGQKAVDTNRRLAILKGLDRK